MLVNRELLQDGFTTENNVGQPFDHNSGKTDTLVSGSKGVIRSIGMHLAFPLVWFSTSSSVCFVWNGAILGGRAWSPLMA